MPTLDDLPELLGVSLVAEYLGISTESVRRLLRSERLIGVFIGRSWRVPKDELRAFIERSKGVQPKRRGGRQAAPPSENPVELAGGRVHRPARHDDEEEQEQGGGGRGGALFGGPGGWRTPRMVG